MDLSSFESICGVHFTNKDLLMQSFVHRSYLNENPSFRLDHNERLEFLGDAVLELVVTDYLYRQYSHPEGELTMWRAALVNAKILGQIAEKLSMADYMLLSHGEKKDIGRSRPIILANAIEAFIGALYLDQGYDVTSLFIHTHIIPELPSIIDRKTYKDAKSMFQEMAQDRRGMTPHYTVLKEWGLDHDKHFRMGVFLGETQEGEGEGVSKQEAQQEAAKDALHKLAWE